MIGRSALTYLLLLVCSSWLLASGDTDEIRFEHLTREEGLSVSAALCLIQDRQGYIWVGTEDGLNRFDGYTFRVFHRGEDPTDLRDDYIYALAQSSDRQIWIGTKSGGLCSFDPATETFQEHELPAPGLANRKTVKALEVDPDGRLWIGTEHGLYAKDENKRAHLLYSTEQVGASRLSGNKVFSLAHQGENLWVGTNQGLNRVFRDKGVVAVYTTTTAQLPGNTINSLLVDSRNRLWVGTNRGLMRYRQISDDFTAVSLMNDEQSRDAFLDVYALSEGRDGVLWVGTAAGLVRLQPDVIGAPIQRFRHRPPQPTSLRSDQIRTVYEDPDGILWVGSWGGSVSRFDRNHEGFSLVSHQFDREGSLAPGAVWTMFEDRNGGFWVGTAGGGLSYRKPGAKTFIGFESDATDPNSISDNDVQVVTQDLDGEIWLGTFKGLNRFDSETGRVTRVYQHVANDPTSLSDNQVWTLKVDLENRLWIGTNAGGLNLLDADRNQIRHFRHNEDLEDSLSHDWVMSLTLAKNGTAWVGTFGGGLNATDMRDPGHFTSWQSEEGNPRSLSHNNVSCILEDEMRRSLWLATYGGGLNEFDPRTGTFRSWRVADGLPDDNLYGILRDKSGYLWCSTNNGLVRFDPDEETFKVFHTDDGLRDNEYNSGAFMRGTNDRLYFGGVNGFVAFFPENIRDHLSAPRVVLTDLLRDNKPVKPGEGGDDLLLDRPIGEMSELTISHRAKMIALRFSALHYAAPMLNRYAYKLDGFDDEWIETTAAQRQATYTGLDPGRYTFKVKASNKDGVWQETPKTLSLVVKPPPWLTWWASTLYTLLGLALIFLYVSGQRRKLEKERSINERLKQVDRLRDDFLANTSHELRTPLNGIIGLTESLIDGAAGELSPPLLANLDMVIASGRRLASLVDDILDFSKLKHGSLSLTPKAVALKPLVDMVQIVCGPLIGHKPLALKNEIPEDLPPVHADGDRLQQILYNLIGNAIRFTDEGEVVSEAVVRDEMIYISVRDTGIGIPKNRLGTVFDSFVQAHSDSSRGGSGLGLALTRRLVELHGGTIDVFSTEGQGTTFTFSLPMAHEPAEDTCGLFVSRLHSEAREREVATPTQGERLEAQHLGKKEITGRILVVDDEPVNRQVIVNHLKMHRCGLVTARDGHEALNLLADRGPFDMVLLDIMMPDMSGYEVCRQIRGKYGINELPVIFLTARNQVDDLRAAFESGGNDYLIKPVAKSELMARVSLHLQQLHARRALHEAKLEQEYLLKMIRTINQEMSMRDMLNSMLQQAIEIFPNSQAATAFVWHAETARFEIGAVIGYDQEKANPLTFTYEELVERYVEKGRPLGDDAHRTHQIRNVVPMARLEGFPRTMSMLAMPLAPAGELQGFLILDNFEKTDAFNEADVRLLERFREHATWALAKIRLLETLASKNRQILNTQEQLVMQEKMASLGFLAAGITHEVKNPAGFVLGSIQNMARDLDSFYHFLFSLLEDDADPEISADIAQRLERMRKHNEIAAEGTQRICKIVKELGSFARKDDAVAQPVDLNNCLISTTALARANFKQWVEFDVRLDEPMVLPGFASQLNQVFMNLVVNACQSIKASLQEGDSPGRITISTEVRDEWGIIHFEDSGKGISLADQNRIFEPFFTTKPDGEGTGLGLSISRRILERHGGHLKVSSQEGYGSKFSVFLPLARRESLTTTH